MVALPAFKFVFLGIRQVTRPLAKQIVGRANTKRALTYRLCIGLGRFSLGLSGVISEWTRVEEQKQREAKKKSEEAQKTKLAQAAEMEREKAAEIAKKAAAAAMNAVAKSTGGNTASTAMRAAAAASAEAETTATTSRTGQPSSPKEHPQQHEPAASIYKTFFSPPSPSSDTAQPATTATAATVTPRSRSLLQSVVYGPQLKDSPTDTYDSTVFLDPNRTVGEAARVFIRYPARSSWDVFRQTFLAPFPEDRLVAAGADLMIELVAYTVLCTLLVVELLQQSRTTAAKEAHVNARLEAIESKVKELIEHNNESSTHPPLEELYPVPELQVPGRLGAMWGAVMRGASFVESTFSSGDGANSRSSDWNSAAAERRRMSQSGKVVMPRREAGSSLARAPPRDPTVKLSKYDDSTVYQVELESILRSVRAEKRA
ncbi:hypothetical protein ABL78_7512 [Leptomonas seymouri]|uniref:Uncharacterized protein n=1 Tax=Leptomonas seymouri TaxID=5684 RepID=A0A0N0P2X1_LEPSE|nr:hypothetical protein ABL78_7512 [Leptomonas seymouri]|eukprot:KPI83456.1 hypothetical protein ABL78_7512 [Leptomonas seymouri]